MRLNTVPFGRRAEAQAESFLKKNGYRILGRNVRSPLGEIDLVARDGSLLCFVEIKARSSTAFGWPEEGVTREKQWRLARLAQWYLKSRRLGEIPVRFDVVSILMAEKRVARLRLVKAAF